MSFPLHQGSLSSVAFLQDGDAFAVATRYGNLLTVWNVATGIPVQTLSGHRGSVRSIACTRDGQRVISGSTDGTVKLWDLASGRCLATLTILPSPDGGENSLEWAAYASDGRLRASPGARKYLRRRVGIELVPIEALAFEE